MQLVGEAIIVGIILVITWSILNPMLENFTENKLAVLFIVGALTHFGFEAVGANTWYCEHGNACRKRSST